MSWNGEFVCIKTEAPKPTVENIQSLSEEDAIYMAECFGVEFESDVKQSLIDFFEV
ncbi:hypothetical protein VPH234P10_0102 [Vibrio phage 234P10]|nr:hypothetical protein SIPHO062v1_p0036 [Vibrio phage PS17B.1]